jgi:hypothetical protein
VQTSTAPSVNSTVTVCPSSFCIFLLDGTYLFNDKDSCTFAYQHTESLGKGDENNINDSAYDKIALMMKHKIAKNQAFGAGYQFINFDNHNGTSFDDYSAHGVLVTDEFVF